MIHEVLSDDMDCRPRRARYTSIRRITCAYGTGERMKDTRIELPDIFLHFDSSRRTRGASAKSCYHFHVFLRLRSLCLPWCLWLTLRAVVSRISGYFFTVAISSYFGIAKLMIPTCIS